MKLDKSDKVLFFVMLVILALLCVFALEGSLYNPLPFKKGEDIDLVSIFSGTLITIALIERVIELFISKIETNIARPKDDIQKKNTRDQTLYIGLFIGLLASLVGIRILEPLMDMNSFDDGAQKQLFIFMDVVFSAMGIASGSQLFHIFPSLTSSVFGSAQQQSEANMQSAKLQTENLKKTIMEEQEFEGERELVRLEKQLKSVETKIKLQQKNLESIRIEKELESETPDKNLAQ